MAVVEIKCADCGCVVDLGIVIVACGKPGCCCEHLPVRSSD